MSVPKRRRTSGRKRMGQSHDALKPKNLIKGKGQAVPHALKKAQEKNLDLKTRS